MSNIYHQCQKYFYYMNELFFFKIIVAVIHYFFRCSSRDLGFSWHSY